MQESHDRDVAAANNCDSEADTFIVRPLVCPTQGWQGSSGSWVAGVEGRQKVAPAGSLGAEIMTKLLNLANLAHII